jgi:hypothetical protein
MKAGFGLRLEGFFLVFGMEAAKCFARGKARLILVEVVVTQIGNAIGYAKFFSRSHDAVIRTYDAAGNVIETQAQRTARGRSQELNGDLTRRGVYESARRPITASPHRCTLAVPTKELNPESCILFRKKCRNFVAGRREQRKPMTPRAAAMKWYENHSR